MAAPRVLPRLVASALQGLRWPRFALPPGPTWRGCRSELRWVLYRSSLRRHLGTDMSEGSQAPHAYAGLLGVSRARPMALVASQPGSRARRSGKPQVAALLHGDPSAQVTGAAKNPQGSLGPGLEPPQGQSGASEASLKPAGPTRTPAPPRCWTRGGYSHVCPAGTPEATVPPRVLSEGLPGPPVWQGHISRCGWDRARAESADEAGKDSGVAAVSGGHGCSPACRSPRLACMLGRQWRAGGAAAGESGQVSSRLQPGGPRGLPSLRRALGTGRVRHRPLWTRGPWGFQQQADPALRPQTWGL